MPTRSGPSPSMAACWTRRVSRCQPRRTARPSTSSPPPGSEKSESSSMSSRVDQVAWVVEVDGQRWPFEIELATGAAHLRLGAGIAVVQPLSWREKLTLARYAGAGDE